MNPDEYKTRLLNSIDQFRANLVLMAPIIHEATPDQITQLITQMSFMLDAIDQAIREMDHH